MPDITATVGSATANSFVTSDEADLYLDARSNADAWNLQSDDDVKARALIDATRELNVLMFAGLKATGTQALQWPRLWAIDVDYPFMVYIASTIIPQRVKDATCELALEFLKAGTTDVASLPTTDSVIEKKVDVLSTRYADPYLRKRGLARFPRVLALVKPLLSATTGNVIRG